MASKWTKVTVVILVLVCGGILVSLYHARRYQQNQNIQQEGMTAGEQSAVEQPASECGLDCGETEEATEAAASGELVRPDASAQEGQEAGSSEGEFVAEKD